MIALCERTRHIRGVLDEVGPWLERAEGSGERREVEEAGVQVRRLLREAVSVARGITAPLPEGRADE